MGRAQSGPSQEIKNVDATSNVTVNAQLPGAPPTFKLSGTVGGNAAIFLSITATSTDALTSVSGSVDPLTKKYSLQVPANTYKLSVSYIANITVSATLSTFVDPNPVPVSADTVRDVTIVPVVTHKLSGKVTGLDSRFSTSVMLITPNDSLGTIFTGAPAIINADGSYAVQVGDGTYSAFLGLSSKDANRAMGLVLGNATVNGADVVADFNVPTLASLAGAVQMGDGSPLPGDTSVSAVEGDIASLLRTTTGIPLFGFGTASADTVSGAYQLILPTGHIYTVSATTKLIAAAAPQTSGQYFYVAAGTTQLDNDAMLNLTFPTPPATVTISGAVTDSTGAAAANVTVDAVTAEVAGTPGTGFSRSTKTDANGNYSLVVLSGTNYDLVFTPPARRP